MTEPLFDVIIYKIDTREVSTIVGKAMRRDSGFYNAEKRAETALMRVNDRYGVEIVPTGLVDTGDVLPQEIA